MALLIPDDEQFFPLWRCSLNDRTANDEQFFPLWRCSLNDRVVDDEQFFPLWRRSLNDRTADDEQLFLFPTLLLQLLQPDDYQFSKLLYQRVCRSSRHSSIC